MTTRPTYHKIQSVFKRDPDNNYKTFLRGEWSDPAFGYLAALDWEWTEKVDGTNTRIHVAGDDSTIGGRSDNAQLHVDLVARLNDIAGRAKTLDLDGLTLYGEGYGAGIQKGGDYRSDKGFILFDVMVTASGVFLERADVEDIASKVGVPVVPIVGSGPLLRAVYEIESRLWGSELRPGLPEGFVMRPTSELRTRRGERVITKVKVRDFPEATT